MQPTPVKINKSSSGQNEPTKNILNLNGSSGKPAPSDKTKKYLWLLLALVLIEAGGLAALYLVKPISPYFKLLPPNTIVSSYFNQTALAELVKKNTDWPPINWGNNELKTWLAKTRIEGPGQILTLFEDQMALAASPNSIWLILATIRVSGNDFQQARNAVEQSLKQNYNLISDSYRQITIIQVKPLTQNKGSLFYGQARGYFMLAND